MSSTLRGYIMTKARDIADGQSVDTTNFVTKSNGAIEALDGSALTDLNPNELDSTGTIPSALLAGVGGGKVLQVVSEKFSTDINIGNTSFEEVCSTSITPSSDTSKVLVLVSGGRWAMYSSNSYEAYYQVERETTELMHGLQTIREIGNNIASGTLSVTYLDSPSSSSEVSYKLNAKSTVSGKNVAVCNALSPITMTLIEIEA